VSGSISDDASLPRDELGQARLAIYLAGAINLSGRQNIRKAASLWLARQHA
jgi:hypothetical protein